MTSHESFIAICKQKALNATMLRSFVAVSVLCRLKELIWAQETPYLKKASLKCGNIQSRESG